MQLDGRHFQLVLNEADKALDDPVQVGGFGVHGGSTGKSEKVFDQVAAASALGGDEFEALFGTGTMLVLCFTVADPLSQ